MNTSTMAACEAEEGAGMVMAAWHGAPHTPRMVRPTTASRGAGCHGAWPAAEAVRAADSCCCSTRCHKPRLSTSVPQPSPPGWPTAA